jgi:hypothetical protein
VLAWPRLPPSPFPSLPVHRCCFAWPATAWDEIPCPFQGTDLVLVPPFQFDPCAAKPVLLPPCAFDPMPKPVLLCRRCCLVQVVQALIEMKHYEVALNGQFLTDPSTGQQVLNHKVGMSAAVLCIVYVLSVCRSECVPFWVCAVCVLCAPHVEVYLCVATVGLGIWQGFAAGSLQEGLLARRAARLPTPQPCCGCVVWLSLHLASSSIDARSLWHTLTLRPWCEPVRTDWYRQWRRARCRTWRNPRRQN